MKMKYGFKSGPWTEKSRRVSHEHFVLKLIVLKAHVASKCMSYTWSSKVCSLYSNISFRERGDPKDSSGSIESACIYSQVSTQSILLNEFDRVSYGKEEPFSRCTTAPAFLAFQDYNLQTSLVKSKRIYVWFNSNRKIYFNWTGLKEDQKYSIPIDNVVEFFLRLRKLQRRYTRICDKRRHSFV